MNDLIRSSEVAKIIGKNSQTVRKLIRDGILVGQKVNERWYITRDSFEAYKATMPATQQAPMQPQKQQVFKLIIRRTTLPTKTLVNFR